MNDLLGFALLAFTSFFTLINPIGSMPIFMTMTADMDTSHRNYTARKSSIAAFITIVAFAFSGQVLFNFFGISADSFRVVGGVIFFLMGMDMLQARLSSIKVRGKGKTEKKEIADDISITPLAIPMIAGPGAITNAIVMMNDADTIQRKVVLIASIFGVLTLTYLILLSSSKILKLIGNTGRNVLMRLMGLIVMVIAVEFFFSGLKPILQDIFLTK